MHWGLSARPVLLGRAPAVSKHPWRSSPQVGRPDTELDAMRVAGVDVRAGSVRGMSHRLHRQVRQDSFCVAAAADDSRVVLVVADGLGSSLHSHEASALAARSVACDLRQWDPDGGQDWADAASQAVVAAGGALQARARAVGHPQEDLRTTVVYAVVAGAPSPDGSHRVWLARVGDSTAVLATPEGVVDLFPGADDHLPSSATACLPDRPSALEVGETQVRPGTGLLLATDGVHVPALTPEREAYWRSRWCEAPSLDDLLVDLHFLAKSYDDDRTLAGAWPVGSAATT